MKCNNKNTTGVSVYKASITREQFLFYEMRTTAKLMREGFTDEEIVSSIINDNLFQFVSDAIGGKGAAREVIRNYFRNDF